jgi:hypothetical protein
VYDTDRPYELLFPGANRAVVMVFPHEMLDLAPDEVRGVSAVRFPRDSGLGKVINPFLAELGRNRDLLEYQDRHRRDDPTLHCPGCGALPQRPPVLLGASLRIRVGIVMADFRQIQGPAS